MIYKKTWKYILIKDDTNFCIELNYFRPKALKDFSDIKKGDVGGYVQHYYNLSQKGNCWVYESAVVSRNGLITDNAKISDLVHITDNAKVTENAEVSGGTEICDDVIVTKNAFISNNTMLTGNKIITNGI
jgi:acetyltransferase-like isoleucine patch superfamily enzyme